MQSDRFLSPVAICRLDRYDMGEACAALNRVIDSAGGWETLHAGMRVAVKANLVSAMEPARAATTHPVLLAALTRLLRERGMEVVIGDSPGGLFLPSALRAAYHVCGLELAAREGAVLNEDTAVTECSFQEAVSARTFTCTRWVLDCDAIIDFAKLKTHAMMNLTCCVKNLFGCIPGTTKPEYHMRFPDTMAFANMLVDLDEFLKPALCLVDAVVGMEGNGPVQGRPRHVGAVLASRSPYNADCICAAMIGMTKDNIPTWQAACSRGLCPEEADSVSLIGGKIEDFTVSGYDAARLKTVTFGRQTPAGKAFSAIAQRALATRPQVTAGECIGCGRCRDICPAHAITMVQKRPVIQRQQCIHCFCCQEFCPAGAMKVHRTALATLLRRLQS